MNADQASHLITALASVVLDAVNGGNKEHQLIDQAITTLETIGGRGGSARGRVENGIIKLVESFDTTRDRAQRSPVSAFMADHERREDALKEALLACIQAHKSGMYEPMVAAIKAAEDTLNQTQHIKAR